MLTIDYNSRYSIRRTSAFDDWMAGLPDARTRVRLAKRLARFELGLPGDTVHVGAGVFEMREFFGPGWRMYFTFRGRHMVVLLAGGDKSTQRQDIARAIELAGTVED